MQTDMGRTELRLMRIAFNWYQLFKRKEKGQIDESDHKQLADLRHWEIYGTAQPTQPPTIDEVLAWLKI